MQFYFFSIDFIDVQSKQGDKIRNKIMTYDYVTMTP